MNEAIIVINDESLSEAESLSLRVAIEVFISHLIENGLGDDEHGIRMKENYLYHLNQIRKKIFKNLNNKNVNERNLSEP